MLVFFLTTLSFPPIGMLSVPDILPSVNFSKLEIFPVFPDSPVFLGKKSFKKMFERTALSVVILATTHNSDSKLYDR